MQIYRSSCFLLFLLLERNLFISASGLGVNLSLPGFRQVFNLGGQKDKEIQDRWWFWLIIGLISALFLVLGFFTWRGVRRWQQHKKSLKTDSSDQPQNGSIPTIKAHKHLGPGAAQSGERVVVEAVELASLEEGKNKHELNTIPAVENQRDPSWEPKYAINWVEVQRRAGPTPQRQEEQRHHHRRRTSGSQSIQSSPDVV